jgi:adenylyltransferase/sulfurtransferase
MKLLLDLPGQLNDELLVLDLLTLSASRVRTKRAGSCPEHAISRATAASPHLEVSFDTLDHAYDAGFDIVDIREPNEIQEMPTPRSHSRNVPMADLLHGQPAFAPNGKTLLVCASGRRSLAAAQELRGRGLADIYSLHGGVKGLQAAANLT